MLTGKYAAVAARHAPAGKPPKGLKMTYQCGLIHQVCLPKGRLPSLWIRVTVAHGLVVLVPFIFMVLVFLSLRRPLCPTATATGASERQRIVLCGVCGSGLPHNRQSSRRDARNRRTESKGSAEGEKCHQESSINDDSERAVRSYSNGHPVSISDAIALVTVMITTLFQGCKASTF